MNKSPFRILLVEDEVVIARCLAVELERAGYVVCGRVTKGEAAIAAVKKDRPDVILMDIRLAGDLDGVETARRILSSAPIPIIFMTGYSDSEVVDRAKGLNPLGFLFKPIRVERIESLLESLPDRGDGSRD